MRCRAPRPPRRVGSCVWVIDVMFLVYRSVYTLTSGMLVSHSEVDRSVSTGGIMAGKRTTPHDPGSHRQAASARWGGTSYKNAPTKSVSVGGTRFAYRELGIDTGVPVIFLNHLAANLDNWDPRVVDGIAAKHRVITFDNRGVGGSEGKPPDT